MSEILYNESNILQDSKHKTSFINEIHAFLLTQNKQYDSFNNNFRLILIPFTQKIKPVEINIPVQLLF